jgi:formate dehydrogenase maturation protein FdhE
LLVGFVFPTALTPIRTCDRSRSFHVGVMMRIRSRSSGPSSEEPSPFEEVLRRQQQAQERHDRAVEAEDYQAVGMQLRECLLALIAVVRRRTEIETAATSLQDANFIEWSNVLMDNLCSGAHNQNLRQHLKHLAKETWQFVNWLTHAKNADKTASAIAIHSCDTVIAHFVQVLERQRTKALEQCPLCNSRNVRTHFDPEIGEDGDYYLSCGVCDWDNHPINDEELKPLAE